MLSSVNNILNMTSVQFEAKLVLFLKVLYHIGKDGLFHAPFLIELDNGYWLVLTEIFLLQHCTCVKILPDLRNFSTTLK